MLTVPGFYHLGAAHGRAFPALLLVEIRTLYPNVRRVLFSGQQIDDPSCAHFYIAKPVSVEALERVVASGFMVLDEDSKLPN